MVKKKVPDWLNSSLWSTTTAPPPPDDDRPQRYAAPKPVAAAASAAASAAEPPVPVVAPPAPAPTHVHAPVPVPPRDVVSVQQEPPKPQVIVSDTRPSNSDRNDVENGSFVQPQLLSEVLLFTFSCS